MRIATLTLLFTLTSILMFGQNNISSSLVEITDKFEFLDYDSDKESSYSLISSNNKTKKGVKQYKLELFSMEGIKTKETIFEIDSDLLFFDLLDFNGELIVFFTKLDLKEKSRILYSIPVIKIDLTKRGGS